MTKNKKNPTTGANPLRAQAAAERARSNASGTMADRRTKRLRSRAAKKARAINEGRDHGRPNRDAAHAG